MRGVTSRLPTLLPALMLALFTGACDTSRTVAVSPEDQNEDQPPAAADQTATLKILLTDAPADYIAEANVDIGRVEILPVGDGPAIVLSEDGTDGFVNLLDFQKSATMQIAEKELEPGQYHQLRLIVEAAQVKLKDGYRFRGGGDMMDLKVPSGAQTGIKLLLRDVDGEHLELVPGEKVIVLDFDVNRSFVIQGNPETPAGIKSMSFKPTIKVTGLDVAASISGTVSTELDGVSVEGRVVIAEPTDDGDLTEYGYQSKAGTGVTDEFGDYTIYFLVPGEYEVSVIFDPVADRGLGTEPESRTLTVGWAEDAVDQDFEIIDITGSIAGTVGVEEGLDPSLAVGLTVTATPAAEGEQPVSATTDEFGAYFIDDLLPGTYTVAVTFEQEGLAVDPAEAEVEVGRAEDVVGVDFTIIDVTGSISGVVSLDEGLEGVSVVGLTVTATPAAEGQEPVEVETGEGGAYMFEDLLPGTYTVAVTLDEAGFTVYPAETEVELGAAQDVADVNFLVVELGLISGTVGTELSGFSVEGLTVSANDGTNTFTATTDANGNYVFTGLAAATYTLTVDAGTGYTTDPASIEVGLAENGEVTGQNFAVVEEAP